MFGRKRKELQDTRAQLMQLQHTVGDILTSGNQDAGATAGNPYPTAKGKIDELSRKYEGCAQWGSQTSRNIVDIRAAFIIGEGITLKAKEGKKAERELKFLNEFIRHNNLDDEIPQEWAKEAEIEGRFLCRLVPDEAKQQIKVRFVSWCQHSYTVDTDPADYMTYTGARYKVNGSGQDVNLKPREFVYLKFGGRLTKPNESVPKAGMVLGSIEALHKALVDWRKINNLFAAPTPHFQVDAPEQAPVLLQLLQSMSWKIGRFLVTNAKMELVGISDAGVASIKDEIVTNAQLISGTTGVPVHFLGFPELMSNRNTADTLFDLTGASTSRERRAWVGGYNELFRKAIEMANEIPGQGGMDPDAVEVDIPLANSLKLQELVAVWLPIYQERAISQETFLARVPDVDVQEEMARIEKEEAKAADLMKSRMGDVLPHEPHTEPAQ